MQFYTNLGLLHFVTHNNYFQRVTGGDRDIWRRPHWRTNAVNHSSCLETSAAELWNRREGLFYIVN